MTSIIGLVLFLWIVGGSTVLFGMLGRGNPARTLATEPVRRDTTA
jgi:hypothetical protein